MGKKQRKEEILKVVEILQGVEDDIARITSGDVSHKTGSIRQSIKIAISRLRKAYQYENNTESGIKLETCIDQ